jgi:septum formation topological specificity factor MinE
LDSKTYEQLKESDFDYPEVSEVISDNELVQKLVYDSTISAKKSFRVVHDVNMLDFLLKTFQDGLEFTRQHMMQRGVKMRLITEVTQENVFLMNNFTPTEKRHLGGLKGNFGIIDSRLYVDILQAEVKPFAQKIFFSNSKKLVEKQELLFNELWNNAIPLDERIKELRSIKDNSFRILSTENEILEVIKKIVNSKNNEITLMLSNKGLEDMKANILEQILNLVTSESNNLTRILITGPTNNKSNKVINEFLGKGSNILFEHHNHLTSIKEALLISNSNTLLIIAFEQSNNIVGKLSKNEMDILVQDIIFEKNWNEIKSLEVIND